MMNWGRRRGRRLFGLALPALAVVVLEVGTAPNATAAQPAGLVGILRTDLNQYLAAHGVADHLSSVSLRVDYPDGRRSIDLTAGTTRYGGKVPVPAGALWQIGSNTKAFTSVMLLQLEAEGRVSIHDTLGKWLPQYPAWRDIPIERVLDMTSGIANYTDQDAFDNVVAAAPATTFTPAQLVSYVVNSPVGKPVYSYSNTNYVLAQMIIERITHDTYAHQLARRITGPLGLRDTCFGSSCPAAAARRMPAGYDANPQAGTLFDKPVPALALSWAQGAGAIVASLRDMTTWDRALYTGELLPPRQEHELKSLISIATSQPIPGTTAADPGGFGLGVGQSFLDGTGQVWSFEGGTLGFRTVHIYNPRTGIVIAVGLNSNQLPQPDTAGDLVLTVARTLTDHGNAPTAG